MTILFAILPLSGNFDLILGSLLAFLEFFQCRILVQTSVIKTERLMRGAIEGRTELLRARFSKNVLFTLRVCSFDGFRHFGNNNYLLKATVNQDFI